MADLMQTPLRDWPAADFAWLVNLYKRRGGVLEKFGVRVLFCRPNDEMLRILTSGDLPTSFDVASFWEGPHWYNMIWSSDSPMCTHRMAHHIQSLLAEGARFAYHSGATCREWVKNGGKLRRVRRTTCQQ